MTASTPKGYRPIATAPAETDLCLCIEDGFGLYRLPFPCQKKKDGWINSKRGVLLKITPLGWIKWSPAKRKGAFF